MSRPQFTLKMLLWLMGMLAAFFGGMVLQKQVDKPTILSRSILSAGQFGTNYHEKILLPDGTQGERWILEEAK